MNETRRVWRRWVLILVAVGSSIAPACGRSEEPAEKFLQGLRSRGQYDVAIEFLEESRTNELVSAEFREVIDLELGATRLEAARAERDPAVRKDLLDKAADSFRKFADEHKDHPRIHSARQQLANVLIERGRYVLQLAKRAAADEEAALREEARKLYSEALEQNLVCEKDLFDTLDKIPKVLDRQTDREAIAKRTQLRANYLQAQLVIGAIREELAGTWTPSEDEHREELTAAAKQYGEVYKRYRTRLAGLYAHMYQGRCLQKLGEFDNALKNYDAILKQPDSPDAFRDLKSRALLLALECWSDPTQKQYATAVTQGEAWLEKLTPAESSEPNAKRILELVEEARRLQG